MGFINKYMYNIRLGHMQEQLEKLTIEKGKNYLSEKLTITKNGDPLYLINYSSIENGYLDLGCIHVLTPKGFDRNLHYLVVPDKNKYIKIGDIRHEIICQGIGTQLLIFLEEIAKSEGINKITAWLSPVDLDNHRDRLLHFYEKNGYQITQGKINNMLIEGLMAAKYF